MWDVWIRFPHGLELINTRDVRQGLSSAALVKLSHRCTGEGEGPFQTGADPGPENRGWVQSEGILCPFPPFAEKLEGPSSNLFHHILSHCFQPTPALGCGILHHTQQGMKSLQLMETNTELKNWAPFWWAAFAFTLSCDLGCYHPPSANTELCFGMASPTADSCTTTRFPGFIQGHSLNWNPSNGCK